MLVWFAPLEAHRVRVCAQDFAGGLRRSGCLQELLRRNDGSPEGVARTVVLSGGSGQVNVVILYIFVRLGLPGPRKARPARASPPRPRARESCSPHTSHAYAPDKGAKAGEKGVDDDCGEGHMTLSEHAVTAGRGLEGLGVLVHTPPGAHCCTSELCAHDSCATSARFAIPLSPATQRAHRPDRYYRQRRCSPCPLSAAPRQATRPAHRALPTPPASNGREYAYLGSTGHEILDSSCIQSSEFSFVLQFCTIWRVTDSTD